MVRLSDEQFLQYRDQLIKGINEFQIVVLNDDMTELSVDILKNFAIETPDGEIVSETEPKKVRSMTEEMVMIDELAHFSDSPVVPDLELDPEDLQAAEEILKGSIKNIKSSLDELKDRDLVVACLYLEENAAKPRRSLISTLTEML